VPGGDAAIPGAAPPPDARGVRLERGRGGAAPRPRALVRLQDDPRLRARPARLDGPRDVTVGPRDAPTAPFAGTTRFRSLGLVGRGSMGAVHCAWDEELGCVVALKTLEHLAPEQIYRLKQEFRFVAGLTHPNLVQLHELVVTDDACFFTMELVEGDD